jgi:isopentenyl-diphosphate delta-isomerase
MHFGAHGGGGVTAVVQSVVPAPGSAPGADVGIIPAIAADGSLFPIGKMAAHRHGVLHQAVSVFVFSGDELLIQQRAATKYHCGSQWANSCCTHPHWGEDAQTAADRRVREELGCSVDLAPARILTYAAKVTAGLFEHERVQVFRGAADKATLQLAPDPDEVQDTRWVSLSALRSEMSRRPHDFTPWFQIYLARWSDLGI